MRKKAKYILASLLMFCIITTSVNAEGECSYDKQVELNNLAATVKAVYEEVEIDSGVTYIAEEEGDPDGPIMLPGFKIKILNLSENLSVTVSESESGLMDSYSYLDSKNGTIEIEEKLADSVYNYTIEIFGSIEGCDSQKLRTINLVVPRYNEFSEYEICKDYPEYEYCQKYTTSMENITMNEFVKRVENYKKNHKSETSETKENKKSVTEVLKNKKVVAVIIIVAIVGVATTTILIIRRRSRLI